MLRLRRPPAQPAAYRQAPAVTYDDVAEVKAALVSIAALLEQILAVQERQLKELQHIQVNKWIWEARQRESQ